MVHLITAVNFPFFVRLCIRLRTTIGLEWNTVGECWSPLLNLDVGALANDVRLSWNIVSLLFPNVSSPSPRACRGEGNQTSPHSLVWFQFEDTFPILVFVSLLSFSAVHRYCFYTLRMHQRSHEEGTCVRLAEGGIRVHMLRGWAVCRNRVFYRFNPPTTTAISSPSVILATCISPYFW